MSHLVKDQILNQNQRSKSKEQEILLMMIIKNVEIVVPLKYLSNFWRSLEIPFFN